MKDHPKDKPSGETGASFDLFTVLGHDLKSPLNAVESYLEIIHDKVLGEEIDPYLPIVDNSISRLHQMRELITDVVDWSKILSTSSLPRSLAVVDVSKAARAILEGYRKEAEERNMAISSDMEDALTMKASAREIDLILRHLISNALRYNNDGGRIDVTVKKAGPRIAVSVSDNGMGMTREDQSLIFQEFVRIKNEKTRDIRGTGLGLAIVGRLVDAYHGTISVESEEGRGTTFTLTFPCGD